jgi:hypothetical protein
MEAGNRTNAVILTDAILTMEDSMKQKIIVPLLAVLLFTSTGEAFAQAVFVDVHGTVEVRPAGASNWTAAAEGLTVAPDTAISTSFRSTAIIRTGSSRILLRPLTRLTLEEIIAKQGTEEIRLTLRAGRIRAEVSPPQSGKTDFTVRSPMTVASVRGTSFDFDTVNLSVDNGLVRYSYINGLTVYVAGQEESYAEDQARRVVPPQELAAASHIPQIPLYTGIKEAVTAPRYPANSPSGGGAGLVLTPGWTGGTGGTSGGGITLIPGWIP